MPKRSNTPRETGRDRAVRFCSRRPRDRAIVQLRGFDESRSDDGAGRGRHFFIDPKRALKHKFQACRAVRSRDDLRSPLQHEIVVVQHDRPSIATLCKPCERLAGALVAFGKRIVQFDDNDGIFLQERLLRSPEDFEVEAVDIDLYAVDPFNPMLVDEIVELVEGIGLYLSFGTPQTIDPILSFSRNGAQGDLMDLGVLNVVVLKIGPKHCRRRRRFEREDATARGKLRKQNRIISNVGADIEDPRVRTDVINEPSLCFQFALGVVVAKRLVKRN